MKSIRTNPTIHATEGDERIRTAARGVTNDCLYERVSPGGVGFYPVEPEVVLWLVGVAKAAQTTVEQHYRYAGWATIEERTGLWDALDALHAALAAVLASPALRGNGNCYGCLSAKRSHFVVFECRHTGYLLPDEHGDGSAWCQACGEFRCYEDSRCAYCDCLIEADHAAIRTPNGVWYCRASHYNLARAALASPEARP